MNNKKKLLGLLFPCLILVLTACSSVINNSTSRDIRQIEITDIPRLLPEQGITLTAPADTKKVADYFHNLTLKDVDTSQGETASGHTYIVTITYQDDTTRAFAHMGNQYLSDTSSDTLQEMKYKEAIQWDLLLGEFLKKDLKAQYSKSVTGIITGVTTEIFLKTSDGKEKTINTINCPIFDCTGNGWLLLHEGDSVTVYYNDENDDSIMADWVLIESVPSNE